MEYKRMISVTGMPGLFELVASKNDGAIVKSLEDGTTKFVSSRGHNFSHLESIEVYTTSQNVNLADVFKAMDGSNEPLPADNDAKAVNNYFETVFPEMDSDRVYASDKKKMVKWFTILKNAGVELKTSNDNPSDSSEEAVPEGEEASKEAGTGNQGEEALDEEARTGTAENTEAEAAVPSPS